MGETVSITEEEKNRRDKLLRWKKLGMLLTLLISFPAGCAVIYLLQILEKIDTRTLYTITTVITLLFFAGILFYRRFARLINLDLLSDEKIVTIGIVIRSNFIGNRIYPTRVYKGNKQKYLTLNVDGKWLTLSGMQIKRLLPEVWQLNHVTLGDQFLMEYTPFGKHLMSMRKL